MGVQDAFIPEWVGDFAIAEKLRIPVSEVERQPMRMRYRAAVMLQAERHQQELRDEKRGNG